MNTVQLTLFVLVTRSFILMSQLKSSKCSVWIEETVLRSRVMNEADELRTSEAVDGKLPCEDLVTK